ncbi:hypothetical protein BDQ12DRAFT_733930 [Crucibulum laeve]|uniref:F-box domain-containing protein n=1 Tax=Crucibulum laeve TaxID=68775 RepID=A0A5C3M5Q8_9AGAR|nr:hypothetical protein BDQ12DRAFT_733930 [Crucibulum laeve]
MATIELFKDIPLTSNSMGRILPLLTTSSSFTKMTVRLAVEGVTTGKSPKSLSDCKSHRVLQPSSGSVCSMVKRGCCWGKIVLCFRNVRHLTLKNVTLEKFSDFMSIVCDFPLLETLVLDDLSWQCRSINKSRSSTYYRQLRRPVHIPLLRLRNNHTIDIARWLMAQHHVPSTQVLHFESGDLETNKTMRDLIAAVGSTVEVLQYTLPFSMNIQEYLEHAIDVNKCTNLRILHLYNVILIPSRNPPCVAAILNQASSPHLEKLVLTILFKDCVALDCFDWVTIGEMLSTEKFPSLKSVQIRIPDDGDFDCDEAENLIRRQKLSTWDEQGVLEVERFYPSNED